MNDAYGVVDGVRQACHDIRQPIAGVLALAGAALAEAGLLENTPTRPEQIVGLAEWQSDVIEHWLQASGAVAPDGDQSAHYPRKFRKRSERLTTVVSL